jgi:hypothetical protein
MMVYCRNAHLLAEIPFVSLVGCVALAKLCYCGATGIITVAERLSSNTLSKRAYFLIFVISFSVAGCSRHGVTNMKGLKRLIPGRMPLMQNSRLESATYRECIACS